MSKSVSVDAAIVVPWRPAAGREQSFELAWRYNSKEFADFKVYFSDSVGERFNVSEARNRGCLEAIRDGYKTLIVMDADTIFKRDDVLKAVEEVRTKHVISYIYTYSYEVTEKETNLLSWGADLLDELGKGIVLLEGHVGSGWAMSSEMFLEMNGWDENFVGWGWEDNAFQRAYELLFNKEMSRAPGICYRLYHSVRDAEMLKDNMFRYETCYSKPETTYDDIRQLVAGNMVHRLDMR